MRLRVFGVCEVAYPPAAQAYKASSKLLALRRRQRLYHFRAQVLQEYQGFEEVETADGLAAVGFDVAPLEGDQEEQTILIRTYNENWKTNLNHPRWHPTVEVWLL